MIVRVVGVEGGSKLFLGGNLVLWAANRALQQPPEFVLWDLAGTLGAGSTYLPVPNCFIC